MERKGFTLIEILIVVAIIAILASVVLIALGPTQQAGRDARRLADLRQIQNALQIYYDKCSGYPGTGDSACTGTEPCCAAVYPPNSGAAGSLYGAIATNMSHIPGIGSMPQDPSGGATYYYSMDSVTNLATTYTIGARLESQNNAVFTTYNPPTLEPDGDAASMNGCAPPFYCISL